MILIFITDENKNEFIIIIEIPIIFVLAWHHLFSWLHSLDLWLLVTASKWKIPTGKLWSWVRRLLFQLKSFEIFLFCDRSFILNVVRSLTRWDCSIISRTTRQRTELDPAVCSSGHRVLPRVLAGRSWLGRFLDNRSVFNLSTLSSKLFWCGQIIVNICYNQFNEMF